MKDGQTFEVVGSANNQHFGKRELEFYRPR